MMVTRGEALTQGKDAEGGSQDKGRAEDNAANRLTRHHGTGILKPAIF